MHFYCDFYISMAAARYEQEIYNEDIAYEAPADMQREMDDWMT